MNDKTYAPRGDSLAAHVIRFFAANPDEELDLDAIAAKYTEKRNTIHTKLAAAVSAEMLARDDSSGEWVYRAGKKLPRGPGKGKAPPTPSAIERALHGVHRSPQTFISIDPTAVPLDDGVPVPTLRSTAKVDWSLLLERMKPGQSAVLPAPKRAAVSRACKEAKRAGRGSFLMQEQADKQSFRLWRTE